MAAKSNYRAIGLSSVDCSVSPTPDLLQTHPMTASFMCSPFGVFCTGPLANLEFRRGSPLRPLKVRHPKFGMTPVTNNVTGAFHADTNQRYPRSPQQAINTMSPGDRRVLNENELAQRWGVSPKTLQRWRSEGRGPRYLKLSKRVGYPVDAILEFEREALHDSTSERAAV